MSYRSATLLILLSTLGFGCMAFFAKIAYAYGVTPAMLLTLRFFIAALILLPVLWFKRISMPRGAMLFGVIFMGVLYTAQAQSYFMALLHASSGLVALLLYVYPVLVSLLALGLGWEKWQTRKAGLMLMALAGIAITLGGKLQGSALGIALSLVAAVIYAIYILLGARLSRSSDALATSFIVLVVAACGNAVVASANGFTLPTQLYAWMAIVAIALFSTVIAIVAFLMGVKVVGASHASILSTLEPVITIGLGIMMLHETISLQQLLGGALVLTAVIGMSRHGNAPVLKPMQMQN